jgi:hypothetical protein
MAACITLGRPMGKHGPVRRRPARELVYDDEWGHESAWVIEPADAQHTAWRARGH